MRVAILMITHGDIGHSLLSTVTDTFEKLPLPIHLIAVSKNADPEQLIQALQQEIKSPDQGQGVLILTDIYGSTPANIANALFHPNKIEIVSGVNLPMLVRVMNYPQLSLHALAQKALSGGIDCIVMTTLQGTSSPHDH